MAKKQSGDASGDLGIAVIREVLEAAKPRPSRSDAVGTKNQYAVRFAEHMASRIASDLFERLENITASTKRTAGSVRGKKQLDINFSTPQLGLGSGNIAQVGTSSRCKKFGALYA